jgi:hypothetical protein
LSWVSIPGKAGAATGLEKSEKRGVQATFRTSSASNWGKRSYVVMKSWACNNLPELELSVVTQDYWMVDTTSNHSEISGKRPATTDLPALNRLTASIQ